MEEPAAAVAPCWIELLWQGGKKKGLRFDRSGPRAGPAVYEEHACVCVLITYL